MANVHSIAQTRTTGASRRDAHLDDPSDTHHDAHRTSGIVGGTASAPTGLHLAAISHAFDGKPILRGVSVTVDRGEVVCLLGPSGCGKTTLLRLAAGLERLQQGRICVGDAVVADAAAGLHRPPEQRHVGLMFQDYALFPHLTVQENVCFGIDRSARNNTWVRAALARMELADWARAYPHTLSGGQQQRCALLRALAPQPKVLLLDEPFSGLDVALRAQVREETAQFLRDTDISTLLVTHDPEEAMVLADRLLVMRDGRVVQEGTPAEIYLHPREPFVVELFGPVNRWAGRVTGRRLPTPLGFLAADGADEGSEAVALIRPEGILLDPDFAQRGATGHRAVVLDRRLIGGLSAVTLATEAGDWRLRALVTGIFLPTPGSHVGVTIDPGRVFVFAAAAGEGAHG